jgi:hypothetical protein
VEQTGTPPRFEVHIPEDVTYRVVGGICEAPEFFTVTFYFDAEPKTDGMGEAILDVWLTPEDRFEITRIEIRAPEGGIIDFGTVHRFQARPLLRQVASRVVRVTVGVIDQYVMDRSGRKPSTLEQVAFIYGAARLMGEQPTKAVADKLGISREAAAQQVRRARQKGLLQPTTPGKVR